MHFASELSYPFIWCSKTSKQCEVLENVLTLSSFSWLLRLCLLGSPLTPWLTALLLFAQLVSGLEIIDWEAETMNVTSCIGIIHA